MQNQGIAQVEGKGRTQRQLNVIRVAIAKSGGQVSGRRGAGRAQSAALSGNCGSFPGLGQAT
jgi:hypothetical protein